MYPKPDGFQGGPDGTILRTGSGGRLGLNAELDDGEFDACSSRVNEHTIDYFDGGGA